MGLFYLQVIRGSYYSEESRSNRIRLQTLEAPRGRIFDRNGTLLVGNRISFDVAAIPQELGDKKEQTFTQLGKILGVSSNQIKETFNKNRLAPFAPTTIRRDIGKTTAIRLEEAKLDMPGIMLQTKPLRNYLYGNTASHVIGYLGLINREELTRLRNYGYERQDLKGRSGLEKSLDNYLKGREGGMQLEVNNRGRQLRMLGVKEPIPGKDIHLTIDIKLQQLIDDMFDSYRGVAIVMDVNTGEILSLVSKPNFNPKVFVDKSNPAEVRRLLKSPDYPMVNRALNGKYPPGSVFKVVVAAAALEKKKASRGIHLNCKGSYVLGKSVFRCWKKKGHGGQNLTQAIKNSCNVFFYQLGRIAGADNITDFSRRFGYGAATGIDLEGEASGLVPGRVWKMMAKREGWYEGDTLNFSIGQGYLLVTPIQVARMMAAVANGGKLVTPYLVKKIDFLDTSSPEPRPIKISPETIDLITEGLYGVVNEKGGTGRKARVEGLLVAGKTGTAQAGNRGTHAWFSGFAPVKNPKICVLVFLEHGGKGGLNAAKMAGDIFTEVRNQGHL